MQHPITPPQELVNQWRIQAPVAGDGGAIREQWIATQAARWGADQELEAIRQLLEINGCPSRFIDLVIDARRPKSSIAGQALAAQQRIWNGSSTHADWELIRRALERLAELEALSDD